MPQSIANQDRPALIQQFVVKYIHNQRFAEDNGVPKKRLIKLLRNEFCHEVRDTTSEQTVKREMEHAVRLMCSQSIIQNVEIPGCMVAFRLHPDFNLRGMVGLPDSRETSVELDEAMLKEANQEMEVQKPSTPRESPIVEDTIVDTQSNFPKSQTNEDAILAFQSNNPGRNDETPVLDDEHNAMQLDPTETDTAALVEKDDLVSANAEGGGKKEPEHRDEQHIEKHPMLSAHLPYTAITEESKNGLIFNGTAPAPQSLQDDSTADFQTSKDQPRGDFSMAEVSFSPNMRLALPSTPMSIPDVTGDASSQAEQADFDLRTPASTDCGSYVDRFMGDTSPEYQERITSTSNFEGLQEDKAGDIDVAQQTSRNFMASAEAAPSLTEDTQMRDSRSKDIEEDLQEDLMLQEELLQQQIAREEMLRDHMQQNEIRTGIHNLQKEETRTHELQAKEIIGDERDSGKRLDDIDRDEQMLDSESQTDKALPDNSLTSLQSGAIANGQSSDAMQELRQSKTLQENSQSTDFRQEEALLFATKGEHLYAISSNKEQPDLMQLDEANPDGVIRAASHAKKVRLEDVFPENRENERHATISVGGQQENTQHSGPQLDESSPKDIKSSGVEPQDILASSLQEGQSSANDGILTNRVKRNQVTDESRRPDGEPEELQLESSQQQNIMRVKPCRETQFDDPCSEASANLATANSLESYSNYGLTEAPILEKIPQVISPIDADVLPATKLELNARAGYLEGTPAGVVGASNSKTTEKVASDETRSDSPQTGHLLDKSSWGKVASAAKQLPESLLCDSISSTSSQQRKANAESYDHLQAEALKSIAITSTHISDNHSNNSRGNQAEKGTVAGPISMMPLDPRIAQRVIPETQQEDEPEAIQQREHINTQSFTTDQSLRDAANSLLMIPKENSTVLASPQETHVPQQPDVNSLKRIPKIAQGDLRSVPSVPIGFGTQSNPESLFQDTTSRMSSIDQRASTCNSINEVTHVNAASIPAPTRAISAEVMLVIKSMIDSGFLKPVQPERDDPMTGIEVGDNSMKSPTGGASTVATSHRYLERRASNTLSQQARQSYLDMESEPASAARTETGSTIEVDTNQRMDEDNTLDSSQPILTPSRKRMRVMEIAPSDQSSIFDPVSPASSTHSTPQRPAKRIRTPLSGSRRASTSMRFSPGLETTVVMQSFRSIVPSNTLKDEDLDKSEFWLKQAVERLREQWPDDNIITDNGFVVCVDCNKRVKPQKNRNISHMGTHLRGQLHKDQRARRGERLSLATSILPSSNNISTGYGFDQSTSRDQIDAFVRKEDDNAAYHRDMAHKAEQEAAKAKIVREQHLLSQFASLEDSTYGRLNKIESSVEALRKDHREQESNVSDKFAIFEDSSKEQISDLTMKISFTESHMTDAENSIQEVEKKVDNIETNTTSKIDSMLSKLARSDLRNIERSEKQENEHAKLKLQVAEYSRKHTTLEEQFKTQEALNSKQSQTNRSHKHKLRILEESVSTVGSLQMLIDDRNSVIKELDLKSEEHSKHIQQLNRNFYTIQDETRMLLKEQADENDKRVETMKREHTTRMSMMRDQFSDRVRKNEKQFTDHLESLKKTFAEHIQKLEDKHHTQIKELEAKHYSRIKKLENKVAGQQSSINVHEQMIPVIMEDSKMLHGYCANLKEGLVKAAEIQQQPTTAKRKKSHRSRTTSAAP